MHVNFSRPLSTVKLPIALTETQLRRYAPSIYAERPYHAVSDRYQFIPTAEILAILANEGYHPIRAFQSRSRLNGKAEFTRHVVRLRHETHIGVPTNVVGTEIPEISLMNSHDRSSLATFDAGIFRTVCANGMVVNSADLGSFKVRHVGHGLKDDIMKAIQGIAEGMPRVLERIERWKTIDLTPDERGVFARAARQLLPPDKPIDEGDLIRPIRGADMAPNLWNTFNVVQEKVIKGGLRTKTKTGRTTHTRTIKDISKGMGLDKALWTLTEEFDKLLSTK